MRRDVLRVLCAGLLAISGVIAAQSDYGPRTPREEWEKLPVGATYVAFNGELWRKGAPGKPNVVVSHKPGCQRDPQLKNNEPYRPLSSPDCREEVPGPFFVYPDAPPFQYALAKPQTHGLDLTVINEATSKAYFKWLCENEAGDWIYKKVEGVEGIFSMRNRPQKDWGWEMFDRFYVEDIWGQITNYYTNSTSRNPHPLDRPAALISDTEFYFNALLLPEISDIYTGTVAYAVQQGFDYFERPLMREEQEKYPGFKFGRFYRPWPKQPMYVSDVKNIYSQGGPAQMRQRSVRRPNEVWLLAPYSERQGLQSPPLIPTNEIKSRYGFFWRGIERTPQDRLLGISGTEEYLIDMRLNEILSLKRIFVRADRFFSAEKNKNVSWNWQDTCQIGGRRLYKNVLIPKDSIKTRGIDLRTAPGPEDLKN